MKITGKTITDEQCREARRAGLVTLDTLMVAIHSADRESRRLAREQCAAAYNAIRSTGAPP